MNEIKNNELLQIESEIITLKNQTAQNIIQIGHKLMEAKDKLSHGEWGDWLRDKIDFSQRTANQFMRIAKEFGSNSQSISNLEITKVGLLLDVPADKREDFMERHNIKSMSTRELKSVINKAVDRKPCISVIDFERDSETYVMNIDELKPLTDHELYFPLRWGRNWIDYLNAVDKYGITEDIMIARDNTIISGHERVRACRDLGIKTVKCFYACQEEQYRKGETDDELKLELFLISNMKSRSSDYYIAQFWLDMLFDTNYGDKSGDISHYLTDEKINELNHNNRIMKEMLEVVKREKSGLITEDERDRLIDEFHGQYM